MVLPDPVGDLTITSLPLSNAGRESDWIFVKESIWNWSVKFPFSLLFIGNVLKAFAEKDTSTVFELTSFSVSTVGISGFFSNNDDIGTESFGSIYFLFFSMPLGLRGPSLPLSFYMIFGFWISLSCLGCDEGSCKFRVISELIFFLNIFLKQIESDWMTFDKICESINSEQTIHLS